jgi:hypothetical protein
MTVSSEPLRRSSRCVLGPPVVGGAVHRLAREYDPSGIRLHNHRLMSPRVAGSRHDPDPVGDVSLSAAELVASIGEVVETDDRVVPLAVRGIELDLLREDRRARETRIPPAVIQVEVAVHDDPDVPDGHAGRGERLIQGTPNGVIELLHLLGTLGDAGVEEHESVGVVDQVAADNHLLPRSRIAVVRHREVTEQDTPDAVEGDHETAL